MNTLRITLRVVFYRQVERWVAHCLEFDLCGDGPTREAALTGLTDAIRIQEEDSLAHGNRANLFSPADGKLFQMFAAGKDVGIGQMHLKWDSIEVESAEAREYSDGDLVCA